MNALAVVVSGLIALPVGWFSGILVDRVPDRLPLFDDLEGPRLRGRYLWIHIATVVLFVAIARRLPSSTSVLELVGFLLLTAMLITVSTIDLMIFRLPDRIVIPTLGASIVIVVVASLVAGDASRIRYAFSGAGLYFGFLLVAHLIFPRGMGFGDVKLAAVMGLYVGWLGSSVVQAIALVLWAMLIGFVLGSIIGIVMFAINRRSKPIPFGPFLATGTLAVVLLGTGLVTAN